MHAEQTTDRDETSAIRIEQGVCHVLFAYDLGLAIDLRRAERLITATTQRARIKHKRRAPHYFEYQPPPLRLTHGIEPQGVAGFHTTASAELVVYGFGAVSVAYQIPLGGVLEDLLPLADELYDHEGLLADSRRQAEELLEAIRPSVKKPRVSDLVEDYAIYQLERITPAGELDRVVLANGPTIARILRAEPTVLSDQEVSDALGSRISFGPGDMAVLDWNASMLFDEDADDVLAVLEFANVELLEMRFLDDRLDDALGEAYGKLSRRGWRRSGLFRSRATDMRRVAELQVDSAVLFEGVNNGLKLLGDQYLARLYRMTSQRLHIGEWDTTILRKLHTLESIYQKLNDLQTTARMEVLEWIIIILIALSIVLSFIPGVTIA